jgi:hypothetical protein
MPAYRAAGPRRLGRMTYQQGEGPLYIPRRMCHERRMWTV